jgi:hypothetical protein
MFEFLKSPPKIWFRFLPSSSSHSNGPTFSSFLVRSFVWCARKNKSLKSLKSYGSSFGESYQKILLRSFSVSEKLQSVCSFVRSFITLLCCMQQHFEHKRKSNDFFEIFYWCSSLFHCWSSEEPDFWTLLLKGSFLKKRMLMFSHFQSDT